MANPVVTFEMENGDTKSPPSGVEKLATSSCSVKKEAFSAASAVPSAGQEYSQRWHCNKRIMFAGDAAAAR